MSDPIDPARRQMPAISSATGMILAGGLGTRLRWVTEGRQKVVAEVGGRPFVTHLLDQLADAGLQRAVLCTGHESQQVAALGDSYQSLRLGYSRESAPLGTGGAL